jgi:protein SCO1/2
MKILAGLAAAMLGCGPLLAAGPVVMPGVEWQETPKSIADFTLTDQNGKASRFSSLRGKTLLVFFGFANCPDICPTTMHELQLTSVSARVDPMRLQVLMISVDGKRDTPAVLRAFLRTQSQRFMAMTGDPAEVAEIAARFPAAFVTPPEAAMSRSYNIAHTGSVYLIDSQGRLRATMTKASIENMARATQTVQQSSGKSS